MIRRFFAGMLVFLFVILAFPLVTFGVILNALFDRDFYRGEFLDIAFDSGIALVSDEMIASGGAIEFTPEELEAMLKSVFVKDDLEIFIDDFFDQIKDINFFHGGEVYEISLPLDFISTKKSFVAESIADKLIANLEACESPLDFSFEELNCLPEGILVSEIKSTLVLDMEDEIFKSLPSSFNFDLQFPEGINSLMLIISLALVLLLILLALVIHKPLIRILKWEMKALVFASSLLVASFWPLYLLADGLVENFGEEFAILVYLSQVISLKVIFFAAPVLVVSLVLWIVAMIYDRRIVDDLNTSI